MRPLAPCPNCKTADHLSVYKYDRGWQHVECDACDYLGPGEGSKKKAIEAHNVETWPPAQKVTR